MTLETAQMLSTVCRKIYGTKGEVTALDKNGVEIVKKRRLLLNLGEEDGMKQSNRCFVYWGCHHKHPVTLWAGHSYENWEWLCKHGLALYKEFRYRYLSDHKSGYVIKKLFEAGLGPKEGGRTPFAQAMPDQYKHENAITAYRQYYIGEKAGFAKWTKRNPPYWWKEP